MAVNGFYITPQTSIVTKRMFAMEGKEASEVVDSKVSEEVQNKPGYRETRRQFGKLHGISSLLNLSALGCTVFHLFYLAENLNI